MAQLWDLTRPLEGDGGSCSQRDFFGVPVLVSVYDRTKKGATPPKKGDDATYEDCKIGGCLWGSLRSTIPIERHPQEDTPMNVSVSGLDIWMLCRTNSNHLAVALQNCGSRLVCFTSTSKARGSRRQVGAELAPGLMLISDHAVCFLLRFGWHDLGRMDTSSFGMTE